MSDEDPIIDLIDAIIDNLQAPQPDEWDAMSMVIELNGHHASGTYGYFYSNGESFPNAASVSAIEPAVVAYLGDVFGPDQTWPVKMLLQLDAAEGLFETNFEDDDSGRWAVNPGDVKELANAIRPNID